MVRKSVDFRRELKDIVKAVGRRVPNSKVRDITGPLRLEDRVFRRLYTHDPMSNVSNIKDVGQDINLFIKRQQLPNKWKSLPNDVLLDNIKKTTLTMRNRGKKLKSMGMKRRDFSLVLKGEHLITRADNLFRQRNKLKSSLRKYKQEWKKIQRDSLFGFKRKIKNLVYPIVKRHRSGKLYRDVMSLPKGFEIKQIREQLYKPEAKKAYKSIEEWSKIMQSKKNDKLIYDDINKIRTKELDDFNSLVKKLNRRLKFYNIRSKPRRVYDYLYGAIREPNFTTKIQYSNNPKFKKIVKLAKDGLKVKPLKIPKKYTSNFGSFRSVIKNRAKLGMNNLFNKRLSEALYIDSKIVKNKEEAKRVYKDIETISKAMEKELQKNNPIIEHYVNLELIRQSRLNGYNANVKSLNNEINKINKNQSLKRTYNYLKGFIGKGNNSKLATTLSREQYKRIERIAKKPWISIRPMRIPPKYDFYLVAE